MTFLKFQEKPKGSGVYYVYEYRSYREKTKKDKSNYGKVRHALVAYHGRVDKALDKLVNRAPDFSESTWKKLVFYAKASRKPKSDEQDYMLFTKPYTIPELKFLLLFVPEHKLIVRNNSDCIQVLLKDFAKVISTIDGTDADQIKKEIRKIESNKEYKLLEDTNGETLCEFTDSKYLAKKLRENSLLLN
jgi:hypothetical protein